MRAQYAIFLYMKEKDTDAKIDELTRAVTALSKTVETGFSDVRKEIQGVRSELGSEIQSVRSELGAEIQSVRTELNTEIQKVRSDLGAEIQSLRTELGQEIEDLAQMTARGFTAASQEWQVPHILDTVVLKD